MSAKKSGINDLDDSVLSGQAIRAYSLGKAAEGMGKALMSSDITNYFMTNILSINPLIAANIRLFSGIFDAVNDPFIGVCIDRSKNKKRGKLYPFIFFAPIFIALFTVMFFISISKMSLALKIIFCSVALVGWDISFSFYDIPLNALPCNMTNNSVERTKLFGFSSILKNLCTFIPIGLLQCTLFVPIFEKYISIYYLVIAIVISAFILIFSRFTYYDTNEHKGSSQEKPKIKHCFKFLFKNKPLFMLFIANLFSILISVSSALQMYFAVDLMGNIKYKLLLVIATIPSIFFAGLFIPKLIEVLGRKTNFKILYIGCCVVAAIIHLLSFITLKSAVLNKPDGEDLSVPIVIYTLTLVALAAMPMECRKVLSKEMEAQSIDYVQWIYGKRLEATMMSLMTFCEKAVASLSSVLALFIIGMAGYSTHTTYASVPQTPQAKTALLICSTILPMVGYLLMIIPICFYDINGDEYERMIIDIKRRNIKSKYVNQSSMTDLFSGMTEEEIAALTNAKPQVFKIQNMGLATVNAKALYDYAVETQGIDASYKIEAVREAVELPNAENTSEDYILNSSAEFEEDAVDDEDLMDDTDTSSFTDE